jgi:hypothetical protein
MLASAVALPLVVSAATPGYEHIWIDEAVLTGDVGGQTLKEVVRDEVTLGRDESGSLTGRIVYADRLGTDTGSAFGAQHAQMDLELVGSDVDAGVSAGGTFSGTVRVTAFDVASLEEALEDRGEREPTSDTTYRVSGHWGALIDDGEAAGELLFEHAAADTGESPTEAAARLNRLSTENPDALGAGQTFVTELEGPTGSGAAGSGLVAEAEPGDDPGAFGYIARGLSPPGSGKGHVPVELADKARRLREAVPSGATALPGDAVSIDIDYSGAYLDAKNRAAGLLDAEGPVGVDGLRIAQGWDSAGGQTARPVAPADVDALIYYADRLALILVDQRSIPGAGVLEQDIRLIREGGGDAATVAKIKTWADVAAAVGLEQSPVSVLRSTLTFFARVLTDPVPREGDLAEAILTAADHASAPARARSLDRFERAPGSDAASTVDGMALPNVVLAREAMASDSPTEAPLYLPTAAGQRRVVPDAWPAYVSPSGLTFWRMGEGAGVALTDGTVRGWGYEVSYALLVDADRVGRVEAVYPLE